MKKTIAALMVFFTVNAQAQTGTAIDTSNNSLQKKYSNGTLQPGSTTVPPAGTITPNSSTVNPNGTVMPNGTTTNPNGVITPNSTTPVIPPTTPTPANPAIPPAGNTTTPGATTVPPLHK